MDRDLGPAAEQTTAERLEAQLAQERKERALEKRSWEDERESLKSRLTSLSRKLERESKRREQAELRFALLIKRLPWGVLIEDADGRLLAVNERYCSLFRLSVDPAKLEGADLQAMESNACTLFEDGEQYVERLKAIRRSGQPALGEQIQLLSGEIWRRDLVPLGAPDARPSWLHVLSDITKERDKKAELERAKAAAEGANRSTAAFLGAMSHEMRTPLSAVLGLTEILADEVPGATGQELLSRIALNAQSLLRLIEDVLDFAQLDEGKLRLSEGPFSPAEAVTSVAAQLEDVAKSRGLTLQVSLDESLPPRVLGDEARIRQLLLNLVGNAIKFTPSGQVHVRARRPVVGSKDEIQYEVEDTGIGISREQQEHVFERFYRGNPDSPGTGLGLSICRDLVNLMGGRIGLESVEGRGTRVFFTLPLPALHESIGSELDHSPPRTRRSLPAEMETGPRVLLVEDDPDNRLMIARFLEKAGYVVEPVDNAPDGLRLLQDELFDVLVTDISMPGMDGIELVASLRSIERSSGKPPTPAVVVTAHALPEYKARCREAGVDVFLTKPIKAALLQRALSKVTRGIARVLVADDAPDSRILLQLCLNQYPSRLETVIVDSGAAALDACRAETFSIVFLDAMMPGMSGLDTLRAIKKLPEFSRVPFVAVTGFSRSEEIEHLKRGGFDFVLTKPIHRQAIHQVVREHLRAATIVTSPSLNDEVLASSPTLLQLDPLTQPTSISDDEWVKVDSDIRDLIPTFLKNRRADVTKIQQFEYEGSLTEVQRIGHGMKGTGAAYGFQTISRLGARLEAAAKQGKREEIAKVGQELDAFLDHVKIEGVTEQNLQEKN